MVRPFIVSSLAVLSFHCLPISATPHIIASYHYALPTDHHWIRWIADNSRVIQMEDESCWEVGFFDSYTLNKWKQGDPLVITPNHSWFGSFDYYITNERNNTYVQANLSKQGPRLFGDYSHWITDINYVHGYIYLENQTVWSVAPEDRHKISHWTIDDSIVFGLYDTWVSPYDHILINWNMDDYVRVKQY